MGQRLALKEVDKRVTVKLNKSIKADGVNGIMEFGQNNDYPQLIERIINGSSTAKAAAGIYAKFLTGQGFEDESLNNVVVGKDARQKDITLLSLLRQISQSSSYNWGYYIKRSMNVEGKTGKVELIPFKNCRFSKPDDTGYSAKILVYENWERDKDKSNYNKADIKEYHIFSNNQDVIDSQIGDDFNSFKGQIYFNFFDNQYFYPLSPFDAAYMDADTEQQISLFKNRQIRNGFTDKIVFRIQPAEPELDNDGNPVDSDESELAESIKSFIGPDGDSVLVLEDDVDEDGNIKQNGAFAIDKIETNINDKLFDSWEKGLSNNIRKAPNNIPNLLIEIEDGIFSGQSGEAIKQATNFYNAMTSNEREMISQSLEEIFKNTTIEKLQNVTNWAIKPLNLIEQQADGITNTDTTTGD